MTFRTAFCAAALAASVSVFGLAQADATEIKFGIGVAEGDFPEYNAVVRFKDYVEFKTNGEITVRLFPNNQLGGEREMIEQVQQGSLELTFPADGAMAGFYPPMQVWSIPYLFESAPDRLEVIKARSATACARISASRPASARWPSRRTASGPSPTTSARSSIRPTWPG